MDRVRDKSSDSRVLGLLEKMLRQGVMATTQGWTPTEQGIPQGAVISPLLANIYLDPLDHQMVTQGREMSRYADSVASGRPTALTRSRGQPASWLSRSARL